MRTSLKLLVTGMAVALMGFVAVVHQSRQVPLVSAAAVDFFLELEGLDGEFTHIDIESWSWGIVSPRDPASGLPTGKRQYQPIIIRKRIDKTTPLLSRIADGGTQIKKLTLVGQSDDKQKYQVSFFDVFIEEYQNSDEQVSPPAESVSFTFDKIAFEH